MYNYNISTSDIDKEVIYIDDSNASLGTLKKISPTSEGNVNNTYTNIKDFISLCYRSVLVYIEVLLYYSSGSVLQLQNINPLFKDLITELFTLKEVKFNRLRLYNAYLGCTHNLLTKRASRYYRDNILYKYMILLVRNYILTLLTKEEGHSILINFPSLVRYAVDNKMLPNMFIPLVENLHTRDISKIDFDNMLKFIKHGYSELDYNYIDIDKNDKELFNYYNKLYTKFLTHYLNL